MLITATTLYINLPPPPPQYPVKNKVYHLSQQYLTIQDSLIYSEPTPPLLPHTHICPPLPRTTLNHWLRPHGRSQGFRSTRIQEEGSRTDSPVSSGQHVNRGIWRYPGYINQDGNHPEISLNQIFITYCYQ